MSKETGVLGVEVQWTGPHKDVRLSSGTEEGTGATGKSGPAVRVHKAKRLEQRGGNAGQFPGSRAGQALAEITGTLSGFRPSN